MTPDWRPIVEELRVRESNEVIKAIRAAELDVTAFEASWQGKPIDAGVKTELRAIWEAAVDRDLCFLLALYVYARCRHTWELSIDHVRSIGDTIDAVREAWHSIERPSGLPVQLANALLEQTVSLKECMEAENAVQCSCPVALAGYAGSVAHRSARLLKELPTPQTADEIAAHEIVHDILLVDQMNFSGLADVSTCVLAALEDPAAAEDFSGTIERLRRLESHPLMRADVSRSELRAYRHGLTALREYLLDLSIPRLHLPEAGFIYIYPFTFEKVSAQQVADAALDVWGTGTGTTRLAGQTPLLARTSELSDIWYWGHRDQPSYGGATVVMPSLSVTTTAGQTIEGYQAEVRLNGLGNHYVRIVGPRMPMDLHQAFQGLRRGSRYMGEEVVRGEGGVTWARLREYADEVIDDIAAVIGDGDHVVKDIDADGHVHFQIREAVVHDVAGERPATPDDIVKAAGPLLFHPMQSLIASLEEWVRYPLPQPIEDALEGCSFIDSLGARTDNTTSLFLPGAPNWSWIEHQEVVEFVASVSALFRLWRHQVDLEYQQVQSEIERHSAPDLESRPASELALADLRLSLGGFMARVRSQRARLRSDQLVESVAARRLMDNLFKVAELTRLETELDIHIAELDSLYERLTSYLSVLQERATHRYQRFIELVLTGVALFSLAELLGLVNDLFFSGKRVPLHGKIEMLIFGIFTVTVLGSISLARRRA